ncbi:hypothetical protein [Gemmatimonas sp.]
MGVQISTIYGVTTGYVPADRARRAADPAILIAAAAGIGADDTHVGGA